MLTFRFADEWARGARRVTFVIAGGGLVAAATRQGQANRHKRPPRAAFTLVELLVVLSIVGLLVSIALPAVLSARDSANRARCASNLRQIGVALQSFEAVNKRYPMNFCGNVFGVRQCISAHARLLPYLEENALYDTIDWNDETADWAPETVRTGSNTTAINSVVKVFLCPADGFAQGPKVSYRFCHGIYPRWPLQGEGPFDVRVEGQEVAVVDGLSQTAFASERVVGRGPESDDALRNAVALPAAWQFDDSGMQNLEPGCLRANVNSVQVFSQDGRVGWSWFRAGQRHVSYYHTFPPNSRFQDCVESQLALITARSLHRGGVNVLFGDGHISFASNSIDFHIWRAMGTHRGRDLQPRK